MQKQEIYKILKEYQGEKLSKREAMASLGIDSVTQLLALLRDHNLAPEDASSYFQSDASKPYVGDFFHE